MIQIQKVRSYKVLGC